MIAPNARETTMTTRPTRETTFTVRRLNMAVLGGRTFQCRYEAAMPDVPAEQATALVQRGAPWSDMLVLIDASAPYGFLLSARNDVHPLMRAAGDAADCLA
jgi:hypothetical protein